MENRNTWDPHPVNITNLTLIEKFYDTLAESDRGPQVALHRNTVAVQFQIDQKYKETVQLIQNYIQIKMSEIQDTHTRLHMTVDEAYFRLGKIAKLGAARAGVTSTAASQPLETLDVTEVEDKEENEACISMVKTLGQRSDASLSSEASA